ncbi:MAG: DUF1572 family protein [Chitinophagaceae bacterium]|nr:DUF1572 family protein [Chitinophagaceae bacterium]
MLIQIIKQLLIRDLDKLKSEIEQYRDESKIWYTEKSIANSAGNLCLHLAGNLNTYIGTVFGKTNYVRNRDLEFSQKDVPRSQLLKMIDDTILVVQQSLEKVNDAQLEEEFPLLIWQEKTSTAYVLMHLTTHLAYHLGQVNYHRRLLDS